VKKDRNIPAENTPRQLNRGRTDHEYSNENSHHNGVIGQAKRTESY
jgi:hypothetical protein